MFRRPPPPALASPLALAMAMAIALALAAPAAAGDRVPPLAAGDLPVAGTCAPIPPAGLTWVTMGELGWYRVDGDPTDVDDRGLAAVLRDRSAAAAAAGASHDVWIVASRNQSWGHVVKVLLACQHVGLHRVGLQVRAESGEGLMGFPLFLPYRHGEESGEAPRARRLPVILSTNPGPSSDLRGFYRIARNAVTRFGPVVAELSIPPDTNLQYAVSVLDYLYRAGCAAVKVHYRLMIRDRTRVRMPQIWIRDLRIQEDAVEVEIPPVRARKTPWPDEGAAQPGAYGWVLEDVPLPGEPSDPEAGPAQGLEVLPSYAGSPEGVPLEAQIAAERAVLAWSQNLAAAFRRVLEPGRVEFPAFLLVKRRRQEMEAQHMLGPVREAFPEADAVVVSTLRAPIYLLRENAIVGKADVTLSLGGTRPGVIFGRWVREEFPADLVLPPVETDPYAAGLPGHLRVFLEALLATCRLEGAHALPIAAESDVLAVLPTVAHAGVRGALTRRGEALENLAAWLRATPYDRILIVAPEGTAAVYRAGRVAGILRFTLEAEEQGLRLSHLEPRVAPR